MASGVPCMIFGMASFPEILKKSGRNLQQSATEHIEQNALQKGRGIMKNQNQIKVFVSVFLALLSIQGTAMTGAAAMVSTPDPTEQTKEAVTEVLPEEYAPADFFLRTGGKTLTKTIRKMAARFPILPWAHLFPSAESFVLLHPISQPLPLAFMTAIIRW